MSVKDKIYSFKEKLGPYQCKLIAVSKRKSIENIMEAYSAGHRDFGENQVQEMTGKAPDLPSDINWHMIGHLQRNKVKYIAPFIHMIHSVDSERLLQEIEKQAEKNQRTIPCLLQVHIAEEETKFGLDENEVLSLMESDIVKNLKWTRIAGLMGMATNTSDMDQVRKEFSNLKRLLDRLTEMQLEGPVEMKELSMGMTSDYEIALEEGSTMVRVGSAVFGPRI